MAFSTTIITGDTPHKWSVIGLKDEQTGELSWDFVFPVGDGTVGSLELGSDLSYTQMARNLARRTTLLPKKGAAKFVEDLVSAAAGKFIIKARQPGWKKAPDGGLDGATCGFGAFVTPGAIIGPGSSAYRWPLSPGYRPHVGQSAGDLAGYTATIASLAERSNYLAFAIMFNLAGPLLVFVDLPEDPVFNFVGESTTGKTTALKAGASVLGHPDAIRGWNISERGLEETAADCNDLVLSLNAAEKTSPKRRREILNRIIHMLAERASTVRSNAVKDHLPNLTWRTGLLSTSNKTGAQMAAEAGLSWDLQDAVRFMDIPVPSAEQGGIFDRQKAKMKGREQESAELIQELEQAFKTHYGVLLRPWIEYLVKVDRSQKVHKLMQRFLRRIGRCSAVEGRIARKFALVYAAGKMAVEAGLLPWDKSLPWQATKALFLRARQLRLGPDAALAKALGLLRDAVDDKSQVRTVAMGDLVQVTARQPLLGIRYVSKGGDVIGLRGEAVSALVGTSMLKQVRAWLDATGAVLAGHGGRTAQQLPVTLKIGKMIRNKPRFLVLDAQKLAAALAKV